MPKNHLPRKRFGQHFLIDHQIIEKIVHSLAPKETDNLVEIGPGLGALTKSVLKKIPHLSAIEIDHDLTERLTTTYPNSLTVFQANALKFAYDTLYEAKKQKLRIFGNLPYNISTPLLFHLLTFAPLIQDMLFMLQKEVVVRMAAKPHAKNYGRLSIMIQYACQVQPLFDVSPLAFSPPPKVGSSIVRLIPYTHHRPFPLATVPRFLSQVVTLAFSHRRKTLKNALGEITSSQNLLQVFQDLQIDPICRPETLSIETFVLLSNALANYI